MTVERAILLLLVSPLPVLPEQASVLTVCEALRHVQQYRGREIIVVGLYGWAMEGGFLSENCIRSSDGTKRSTEKSSSRSRPLLRRLLCQRDLCGIEPRWTQDSDKHSSIRGPLPASGKRRDRPSCRPRNGSLCTAACRAPKSFVLR